MIRKSVAEILDQHVTCELEAIDRMYLNGYVPSLQTGGGVVYFMKQYLGARVPSTMMVAPLSEGFVQAIARFVATEGLDLVTLKKGQRKDDVAQTYVASFTGEEGVLFVGKAQEKASVFRTEKRRHADGATYPWIYRSTTPVNHYYFYILDRDFGPLFIKFCSYFPYAVKVCLNGHEWLKRQLTQRGIAHEPLDNVRASADPARVQRIANTLDAAKIDAVFRKWLRRLPHPFLAAHRVAGYRYQLSILQAKFALTQVLDRPRTGRGFFEEVMRENLDLGRPDQMQLIFNRRVTRQTPGHFRTRILTGGVVPSLHVDYKKFRIKQYHKEGQALRTETTINNTYDFEIGRALRNLPALREIGFAANRRLLRVEYLSHDCLVGDDHLDALTQPIVVDAQRVAALRIGDRRVLALMQALCLFGLSPTGFRRRDVRPCITQFLGRAPDEYAASHLTYDLRRLRFHGLIERVPHTHRYRITELGARMGPLRARLCPRLPAHCVTAHVWHTPWPARHGTTRCGAHQVSAGGPTCCLTNLTQVLRIHPVKASSALALLRRNEFCLGAQIVLSDLVVFENRRPCRVGLAGVDAEHFAQALPTVRAMLQAGVATDAVVLLAIAKPAPTQSFVRAIRSDTVVVLSAPHYSFILRVTESTKSGGNPKESHTRWRCT